MKTPNTLFHNSLILNKQFLKFFNNSIARYKNSRIFVLFVEMGDKIYKKIII